MERKSFTGVQLKADKPGSFTARIATLNVIDQDGDVTLPGAFPDGKKILISSYQHGSWSGGLPVGKGVIHESGNDVIIDGEFNLNTATGREHYETVKFAPDLQEWSYGYKATDFSFGQQDNQDVRFLRKLDCHEASPVLKGAGVNTALLGIKAAIPYKETSKAAEGDAWDGPAEVAAATVEDLAVMCAWVDSANKDNKGAYKLPHHKADGHAVVWKGVAAAMTALLGGRGGVDIPTSDKKAVYNHLSKHYDQFSKECPPFKSNSDGITFIAQSETALAAVSDLVQRSKSLADLRRKEGRVLSGANRERLAQLNEQIASIQKEIDTLLTETEPPKSALHLYMQYQRAKFFAGVN